ncbi:hypothetical protein BLNAU_10230 [Blattamonas nauphoetae]|uniref:Uncharacterized protein n=1 Tax=Blattamonas nauphoetae TaxID=2049346 RepID=A0ABQ9XTE0_9EUKA|nr:hypothetical protein BLNAU_10230 [Blattamonas nauphoetae]
MMTTANRLFSHSIPKRTQHSQHLASLDLDDLIVLRPVSDFTPKSESGTQNKTQQIKWNCEFVETNDSIRHAWISWNSNLMSPLENHTHQMITETQLELKPDQMNHLIRPIEIAFKEFQIQNGRVSVELSICSHSQSNHHFVLGILPQVKTSGRGIEESIQILLGMLSMVFQRKTIDQKRDYQKREPLKDEDSTEKIGNIKRKLLCAMMPELFDRRSAFSLHRRGKARRHKQEKTRRGKEDNMNLTFLRSTKRLFGVNHGGGSTIQVTTPRLFHRSVRDLSLTKTLDDFERGRIMESLFFSPSPILSGKGLRLLLFGQKGKRDMQRQKVDLMNEKERGVIEHHTPLTYIESGAESRIRKRQLVQMKNWKGPRRHRKTTNRKSFDWQRIQRSQTTTEQEDDGKGSTFVQIRFAMKRTRV